LKRRLLLLALGFGGFGALSGTWASRLPSLKAKLDISNSEIGLALFCAAIGTLAAAAIAARVIARVKPRGVAALGVVAFPPLLLAVALAPSLPVLCGVMLLLGVSVALYDIALNAEAVRAEAAYGRAVLSRLHAGFSLGLAIGAGSGAAAEAQTWRCARIWRACRRYSPGSSPERKGASPRPLASRVARLAAGTGWTRPVLVLTLFGLSAMLAEGVAADWAALLVAETREGGRALGAAALGAFAVAMTGARLGGDWVVDRLGRTNTVWLGAAVSALGLATAAAAPGPATTTAGLFVAGLGLAPLFPNVTGLAAAQDPANAERGVARIAAASYVAFLIGPAASGWTADRYGLPLVFAVCAGLVLVAAALAWPTLRAGRVSGSGA
jgi:MFS family permease